MLQCDGVVWAVSVQLSPILLLLLCTADQASQQLQAVAARGLGASSMLLDDGMSAAELAAMRAELEAYKVGGAITARLSIAQAVDAKYFKST